MFLGHKISLSKWRDTGAFAEGEIQADAITADLRTRDNTLSFWKCGDSEIDNEMVNDAVLAVASNMLRPSKVDLVFLQYEQLKQDGHVLVSSDDPTKVAGLEGRHIEVRQLNLERLVGVASRVAEAVKTDQFRRFTEKGVLELLAQAARIGRLDTSNLDSKLRNRVVEKLAS